MLLTLLSNQNTVPLFTVKWIKVSGVWKQTIVFQNISSVWKAEKPFVKVSGIWK